MRFDQLLKKVLCEKQLFNFDTQKNNISNFIKKIKAGEQIQQQDENVFYHILTGEIAITSLFDDSTKKAWKTYFSSSMFSEDPIWAQRNFNVGIAKKIGKDRTLNYYLTAEKDKPNILKFWKSLPVLDKMLQDLATTENEPISYKTHRLLDSFATHNDSLKIYFYNKELKDQIERVVKEWVKNTGVAISDRTHSFGVDAVDFNDVNRDSKNSYGMILSKHVAKAFANLIKTHKDKYTDSQYIDWLKINFDKLIRQVKPVEFQ